MLESDDAVIAAAAHRALQHCYGIPVDSVAAEVRNKILTLVGTVSTPEERLTAERAVIYLPGPLQIWNRIHILPRDSVSSAEPAAEHHLVVHLTNHEAHSLHTLVVAHLSKMCDESTHTDNPMYRANLRGDRELLRVVEAKLRPGATQLSGRRGAGLAASDLLGDSA